MDPDIQGDFQICISVPLQRMAEAKTGITNNHQSKLLSWITLKPFAIFIYNERLLTHGYSV